MSSNYPVSLASTKVKTVKRDSSRGHIETVFIGDDDEDIICDDIIICEVPKSDTNANNASFLAAALSNGGAKQDENKDTSKTAVDTLGINNVTKVSNNQVVDVEPMEVDSVSELKKPESVSKTSTESSFNGILEKTASSQVLSDTTPQKVFDLSDDNDEPEVLAGGTVSTSRKSRKDRLANTCINFSCKSGLGLSNAPAFVLTHYGLKAQRNREQEVCTECFELAVCHQEKLVEKLSKNECLLNTNFPILNTSVIVLDSDDEGSDVEEALLPEVLRSIDKLLPDVMDSTLKKYDINFHVDEAQGYLTEKLSKMELEMEEMNNTIEETQKCLDEWRAEIYKPYQPIIQSVESVDIVDPPPPSATSPPGLTPIQNRPAQSHQKYSAQNPQTAQSPQKFSAQFSQLTQSSQKYSAQHSQNVRLARRILELSDYRTEESPQTHQQQRPQPRTYPPQQPVQQQQQHQTEEIKRPVAVAMKKTSHVKPAQTKAESEVVALRDVSVPQANLPPVGQIRRPRPRVDDVVYVMKTSFFGAWSTGRIMEVITKPDSSVLFKVRMDHSNRRTYSMKTVTGRHLAYPKPSPVLLPVGTRVIAIFEDEESLTVRPEDIEPRQENYYSGLIVEPPKSMNKYRYLVFFDDGYAQYVKHERVLLVCESSRNVWEDIHPKSRDFIRNYLEQYPERPMVKLSVGMLIKTEWDGRWWVARVIQVDGSLVKMHFDADRRTEWIYRGSTRLAPLYQAQAQAQARAETGTMSRRGFGMSALKKPNTPYVEYTGTGEKEEERLPTAPPPVRAVAKKSTSKRTDTPLPVVAPRPTPVQVVVDGHVQEIRLPIGVPLPKMFVPHQCGPNCTEWVHFERNKMYAYNPLSIPLLCGWQRELLKFKGKRAVMYTAPCGRRLRSMQELHRYLRLVKSSMTVDLFDFDPWVHALAEYVLVNTNDRFRRQSDIRIHEEDLSNGREKVAIPLVNYIDHTRPNFVEYSTTRQPTEGVPLEANPDPDFLVGCDCTDDCQDKEKCSCWQLTLEGTALIPPGVVDPTVGYQYRRLPDRVITGIYECNSRCKCSNTCLNRVVQHPLQLKLQLFKTPDKGWGIRCVNDIPQGTFICIYAGQLLTEQKANEEGAKYGDDYLAELDYIEVVERMKEGYESDVEDDFVDQDDESGSGDVANQSLDTNEDSPTKSAKDSDDDFNYNIRKDDLNSEETIRSRLRKRAAEDEQAEEKRKRLNASSKDKGSRRGSNEEGASVSDDDEFIRIPSSFTAHPLGGSGESKHKRLQSVRKSFGPKENVYIMDANHMGNIGRYLNHSCSPNVFVQNVFVDTHDLRFPWVAFFALTYIRAGSELTWDYSYDVGSVPDKQIQCRCGSSECRGRLI